MAAVQSLFESWWREPPDLSFMRRVVVALNEQARTRFELGEMLGAGKRSAWAVEADDGTRGVLKACESDYESTVERLVGVVDQLWERGYPVPRALAHGSVPGGGYFYLQERAHGRPMRAGGTWSELGSSEFEALLALLDKHAGLAPSDGHDWSSHVEAVALAGSHEWSVVEQGTHRAGRALLQACRRRLAEIGSVALPRCDFVHGDFGPHNVLIDERGHVTAVIDLDDAGSGSRVIDAMGLLYMVEPGLFARVRAAAEAPAGAGAAAMCGVYWIVRRLYQGVRFADPALEPRAEQLLAHFEVLT